MPSKCCAALWMPIRITANSPRILGSFMRKEILRPNLAAHATAELEQSSNAIVMAAAGTALPNLAVKTSGAPVADPKLFDLANELSATGPPTRSGRFRYSRSDAADQIFRSPAAGTLN